MDFGDDRFVGSFRTQSGRRSHAATGHNVFLSLLHRLFWNHVGRSDSQSSGGNSSGATRRFPDVLPACRLHLSRGKHPPAAAVFVELRADALLPGSDSRCVSARRRLAGGLALNPTFENLRLGVVDYSRTPESRELVSAFTEGLVFQTKAYYASPAEMGQAISRGELDAGLVVPGDFAEKRARREAVPVQLLVDAVNANTATIAGGYAARIVAGLNQKIALSQPPRPQPTGNGSNPPGVSLITNAPARIVTTPRLTLLYNPGLKSSWFITTGMIGLLLVLQGSVVSAASLVREKEIGTVE